MFAAYLQCASITSRRCKAAAIIRLLCFYIEAFAHTHARANTYKNKQTHTHKHFTDHGDTREEQKEM